MMTETKSQKFKVYDQEELFRKRRWLQKADAIARAKRAVEAGYPGLDIVCKSVLPSGEAHLYCLGGNSSKCSKTELCHRLLQEGKTMSVEKQEKVKKVSDKDFVESQKGMLVAKAKEARELVVAMSHVTGATKDTITVTAKVKKGDSYEYYNLVFSPQVLFPRRDIYDWAKKHGHSKSEVTKSMIPHKVVAPAVAKKAIVK